MYSARVFFLNKSENNLDSGNKHRFAFIQRIFLKRRQLP